MNDFTLAVLSPYVNYHRPCFFPRTTLDAKARQRRLYHYRDMMTPFDKLASLPGIEQHLKPGITSRLTSQTQAPEADSEAAGSLNRARTALFEQIFKPRKSA